RWLIAGKNILDLERSWFRPAADLIHAWNERRFVQGIRESYGVGVDIHNRPLASCLRLTLNAAPCRPSALTKRSHRHVELQGLNRPRIVPLAPNRQFGL